MRIILVLSILLFCFLSPVYGLEKINQQLFDYAKTCPKISASSIGSLVEYLQKPAKTESQKLEIFCYWIADNIAYDTKGYLSGKYTETDKILITRKGICNNYAELLQRMCTAVKMECHVIKGYSKGYGYSKNTPFNTTDHAWNVVRVDGKHVLVDATWASGNVDWVKGVFTFKKEFNPGEIIADPAYFSETHLPGDPRWQLRNNPITLKSFVANDSVNDMLKGTISQYHFTDSIDQYLKADSIDRIVLSAISTYNFNSTTDNLSGLADAYYNKAWYFSNHFQDKQHYMLSVQWYNTAITYYTKLNNIYGRQWIASARQGIAYSEYKLNEMEETGE